MIPSRFLVMLLAAGLVAAGVLRPGLLDPLTAVAGTVSSSLIDAALCVLLFAAAVQLRARAPARTIAFAVQLSLLATLMTVLVTAVASRWVLGRLGVEVPFIHCLLFGALIAPADPLAMLRSLSLAGAADGLARRAAGEAFLASVFALVCFGVLAARVGGADTGLFVLLMQQAGGGVLLGLCLGLLMLYVLRQHGRGAFAFALAATTVIASWGLGQALALSGPLAAAVAGACLALQDDPALGGAELRERLAAVSSHCAELVTALLLLALAMALLAAPIPDQYVGAAVFALPVAVLARAAFAGLALWVFGRRRALPGELPKTVAWGGLRGGLAAALALSLPPGSEAVLIQTVTFVVLVFSLLLQGPVHGLFLVSARPLSENAQADAQEVREEDAGSEPPVSTDPASGAEPGRREG